LANKVKLLIRIFWSYFSNFFLEVIVFCVRDSNKTAAMKDSSSSLGTKASIALSNHRHWHACQCPDKFATIHCFRSCPDECFYFIRKISARIYTTIQSFI